MSHDSMTDDEKRALLKSTGMKPEEIELAMTPQPSTTTTVAEAVASVSATTETDADDYTAIIAKAVKDSKGNMDTAKAIVGVFIQAEFDKVKLSKIQAAQAGVDRTEHNKAAWAKVQTARQYIEAQVRKGLREGAPTVRGKIAASKAQANPDLDAFLLKHGDDDKVREMAKLMGLSA